MSVIYKVGLFDHMNAKEDALYYKIDNLSIIEPPSTPPTPVASVAPTILYCKACEINRHTDGDCQMILVGGSIQHNIDYGNPYSNTYN